VEDKLYHQLGFYKSLPSGIRNMLGFAYRAIPLSVRYGKTYQYYHQLLQESPYWDDQRKNDFIVDQLKDTLINAYENTPFYRQEFDKAGFDPHTFESLEQLERIPLIDKMDLRKHKQEIKNHSVPENEFLYVTTGGTTGIPVELYYLKGRERSREYAFMTEQWKRIGFKKGDKVAVIRGTVVDDNGKNTLFKFEPIKNRLFLSTYDLHVENFKTYAERLQKFKPKFIHTYPSAIAVFAKYVKENHIRLPSLKGILCSSEQFFEGQRELIETAFHTKVYSWYGHSEYTTLAGECEVNTDYHLFFEYGYTELVDDTGKTITKPGVPGEIVGTSFEMKGFPIIRYKTGDFAEWVEGKCACGRNYQLIKNVIGRWHQEMIITKIGSTISLTALNMHSDIFDHVVQYQFHQKEKGKVNLRIIKSEDYSDHDEHKILNSFQLKFKDLVEFTIKYVDHIPRTERGKHRFLIQELEVK
jgi:phenylacetate-CoA ligase